MNSDDDDEVPPCFGGGPIRPPTGKDLERYKTKLKNVPTLEGLLEEKDPHALSDDQIALAEKVAADLLTRNPQTDEEMQRTLKDLRKKYKTDCKKSVILQGYQRLKAKEGATTAVSTTISNIFIEKFLQFKAPRSESGVLVVTVFTSGYPEDENGKKQTFSCKWNCYYCPNEPGQPRSYLLNEPGVRRANRLEFDPVRQFVDRVAALVAIGHPADKVECLVLGGTWENYPDYYRERFVRDLFFAANTFFDPLPKREKLPLAEEQARNENAVCKIIGLTLETRPDTIDPEMIVKLRKMGCTRVQIGIQHTDDSVLQVVNRESTRGDAVRAIRLLKDSCFKVDIHLMPDLPSSSPDVDRKMFDDVLFSPDLQADQWKIYPCQTTPFSVIQKWYEEGKYRSYGMDALIEVILYAKRRVHPWIRLNRVIRDIPQEYVLEGCEVANLRQLLQNKLAKNGEWCKCIRCREVKGDKEIVEKLASAKILTRPYEASRGKEIFISYETPDERTLFGFLRLRLPPASAVTPFAELQGGNTALIRELHVYGNLVVAPVDQQKDYNTSNSTNNTQQKQAPGGAAQHTGVGKRLLEKAEEIAAQAGYRFIAVISGIGVRSYYRKRGYEVVDAMKGGFMLKPLPDCSLNQNLNHEKILQKAGVTHSLLNRASSEDCRRDYENAMKLMKSSNNNTNYNDDLQDRIRRSISQERAAVDDDDKMSFIEFIKELYLEAKQVFVFETVLVRLLLLSSVAVVFAMLLSRGSVTDEEWIARREAKERVYF